MAVYGSGELSLPLVGIRGVSLEGVVPPEERKLLKGLEGGLMKRKPEGIDATGIYGDPVLYNDDDK